MTIKALDYLPKRTLKQYDQWEPPECRPRKDQLEGLSEQEKEWARLARNRFPTAIFEDYEQFLNDFTDSLWPITEKYISNTLQPNYAYLRDSASKVDAPEDNIYNGLEDLEGQLQKQVDEFNTEQQIRQIANQVKTKAIADLTTTFEAAGVTAFKPYSGKMNQLVNATVQQNVSLVKTIPRQYHDDLQRVVTEGIRSNWTIDALENAIEERFDVAKSRTKTIAMDQTNSLYSAITRAQHSEIGLEKFRWIAVMDNRTRPSHANLHGTIHTWESGAGGIYPGGPINCRCVAIAVRSELANVVAGVA